MKQKNLSRVFPLFGCDVSIAAFMGAVLLSALCARATDNRAPDLSASNLTNLVPPGGTNKVHFHVYAIGLQIYHWDATLSTWGASTPSAVLLDGDGNVVGSHYAGPTWESNSGSTVRGVRIAASTPDSTAIPWLLLQAFPQTDSGIFAPTTYIQRVNTVGGKAPSRSGAFDGEEFNSAYTAEYFFYREK